MTPATLLLNPKTLKPLIYLIIGLVLLLIFYKYGSDFLARLRSKKLIKAGEKDIINESATFQDSDYLSMADNLHLAMSGPGTDNERVLQVVSSLRTKTDWLKLVSAFGVRKSTNPLSFFEGNLVQWLVDELGGDEQQAVNFSLQRFNVSI